MMAEFLLDEARQQRIGLSEAVYCAGKSSAQIAAILEHAEVRGGSLLLTRLDPAALAALPDRLRMGLDYDPVSRTGVAGQPAPPTGPMQVAVVTAGTSDVPVAREVLRTLHFEGVPAEEILDVGVAGLWRLMRRMDDLRSRRVVIVVAGMDAALPSVVGGLVPGLVIAVPTSVGYGVAAGGQAALNAVLASCAPGIAVVNIDNGYGAACIAVRAIGGRTERVSPWNDAIS
ncbi:MAG: nickel pincer cofactor biosynthesis protein LarB [Acetobacteraceae bacterium]|nr:nickel pincer cofactor biosynthesis protein LarB [Acetobacteraceae bacterium]